MKEKEIISKVRIYDYEELSEADRELIDKAKEAARHCSTPTHATQRKAWKNWPLPHTPTGLS